MKNGKTTSNSTRPVVDSTLTTITERACIAIEEYYGAHITEKYKEIVTNLTSVFYYGDMAHFNNLLENSSKNKVTEVLIPYIKVWVTITVWASEGSKVMWGGKAELLKIILNQAPKTKRQELIDLALYSACNCTDSGNLGIITELIARGANVNKEEGGVDGTSLHAACISGSLPKVQLLLENKAAVDIVNSSGHTPLFITCAKGYLGIAALLLRHGANSNRADEYSSTPLHVVCSGKPNNNTQRDIIYTLAKMLLEQGANTNVYDYLGATPLILAVLNNNTKLIQLLLNTAQDAQAINWGFHMTHITPLHIAYAHNNKEIITMLEKHGANPNIKDINDYLPSDIVKNEELQSKLKQDIDVQIIEHIKLKCRGYLTIPEEDKKSFITCYTMFVDGKLEGFQKIVNQGQEKHGAYVGNFIMRGPIAFLAAIVAETPTDAECWQRRLDMLKIIFKDRLISNINDIINTVINIACSYPHDDNLPILKQLLLHAKDINKIDQKDGDTALHIACQTGSVAKVEFLIEKGADVHRKANESGSTALHIACNLGNLEMVEILLQHGADVNSTNVKGDTPLHLSASSDSNCEIIELLLSRGTNILTANGDGTTAMAMSIKTGATANQKIFSAYLIAQDKERCKAEGGWRNTYIYLAITKKALERLEVLEILELLLTTADKEFLNLEDRYGSGLLHWLGTTALPSFERLKLLIKNGANIELRNKNGATPLHVACANNQWSTVEWLINEGANVNSVTFKEQTAIHIVARYGAKEVLSHLIETFVINNVNGMKMDIYAKDKRGRTALDLCTGTKYANPECKNILEAAISKLAEIAREREKERMFTLAIYELD